MLTIIVVAVRLLHIKVGVRPPTSVIQMQHNTFGLVIKFVIYVQCTLYTVQSDLLISQNKFSSALFRRMSIKMVRNKEDDTTAQKKVPRKL